MAGLQQRASAARTELAELAASADRHESRRGRLAVARRAAPVVPLHRLALAAEQQRDRAVEAAATALSRVAGPDEVVDLDTLVRRARASRDTISVATAAVPREGELRVLRERIAADRLRLEQLRAEEAWAAAAGDTQPEHISTQRHPRVRFANPVHVYNNYTRSTSGYGVASTEGAGVFVQRNYFENVSKPAVPVTGDSSEGNLKLDGNHLVGSGAPVSRNPGSVAAIPYSFTLDAAADVKSIVTANAGTGKI